MVKKCLKYYFKKVLFIFAGAILFLVPIFSLLVNKPICSQSIVSNTVETQVNDKVVESSVTNDNFSDSNRIRSKNNYQDNYLSVANNIDLKATGPTTINPNVYLPPEFQNIFVEDVFVDKRFILSKLFPYLKVTNLPDDDLGNLFFNQLVWDRENALNGQLYLEVHSYKWYDENGDLVTSDSGLDIVFPVTFYGFRKVPGRTTIQSDNGVIDASNSNLSIDDVSNEYLKNIIFDNVINKPDNFNANNVIIEPSTIYKDYSRGEIRITPKLSLFYDESLRLKKDPSLYNATYQITISGFKKLNIKPTILPNAQITLKGVDNIAPYQAINSNVAQEKMKEAILLNSLNLPPNFSFENIFFTAIKNIDLDGNVIASGYIDYFYKDDLTLVKPADNERLEFRDLHFSGFSAVSPTKINRVINMPIGTVDNVSPQDVDEAFVTSIMKENFDLFIQNIPSEFNINENLLNLKIVSKEPLKGKITIEYKINRFFQIENGIVYYVDKTKTLSSGVVEINNFKITKGTKLNTPYNVPVELMNIVPSTLTNESIKSLIIYPYYDEIFLNLPNDFTISNITDVKITSTNNARGDLSVDLKINKYYSSNGNLVTKDTYFRGLVITGFNPIQNTNLLPEVVLSDEFYKEILPQNITPSQLLSIINSNRNIFYENIPSNFEVLSLTIESFNNLDGSLIASVKVKNYYDGNDSRIETTPYIYRVKVKGFATIQFTDISATLDLSTNNIYSLKTPEETFLNDKTTKTFILAFMDQLFSNLPYDFVYDNIKINEIIKNNLEGSARIKLEINYYYKKNSSGEIVKTNFGSKNTLEGEVEITGFKKIKATNILDEFTIPNNLYNSLLPSEVNEKQLNDIIWVFRNSIIENLPESFSTNDMHFDFAFINPNNLLGSISVNIELYKYYDSKTGSLIDYETGRFNPLSKNVIISGFKSIEGKTFILPNIDANTLFPKGNIPKPSDLKVNQIIELLLNSNLIINMPRYFNSDNIKINQSSLIVNNKNGVLSFIASINNFYDSNGNWSNVPNIWIDFPVTISNLSSQLPTKVLNVIDLPEFNKVNASDLIEPQLLDILRKNAYNIVTNPTSTFKSENIKSFKITSPPNNKLGQILGTITIDNFYNDNGFINKVGEVLTQDVILIGFQTLGKTYANEIITFEGFENRLPSSVTMQELVERIFIDRDLIYSNLPSGVVSNDFAISIKEKSNQNGTIIVSVKLLRYFNEKGELIITQNKDEALESTITIKGFKKVSPTSIIDSFNVLIFHDTLPSNVIPEILFSYIWDNKELFINSIPDDFDITDMHIALGKYDNKNGTLYVTISLSTFYDNNSQIVVDSPRFLSKEVFLSGFKKIQTTNIVSSVFLPGYSNVLLSEINNQSLKDIIFRNKNLIFFNLVNDSLELEYFDVNIVNRYSKIGVIIAEIVLYRYYDENGNIPNSSRPLRKTIEISGFKQISPSLIPSVVSIIDNPNPNILPNPYDYVINPESDKLLRELISILKDSIFINMPPDFSIDKNLLEVYAPNIENSRANAKGELVLYITFSNYYDNNSILQTSSITKSITITGFKKVAATSVNELISIDDSMLLKKLPQFVTEDELRDFLITKIDTNNVFYNIPNSFNQDSISPVKINSFDNKNGTINATVNIKNYYNANGIIENNKTLSTNVVFSGFLNAKPTTINSNLITSDKNIIVPVGNQNIESNTFENMSQQQLDEELKLLTKNTNNLISNSIILPNDKTTSIEITSYIKQSYNNQNGTILVTADAYNFIDQNGLFVNKAKVILEITGFKIKNSFDYSSDNDVFKYLVYCILGLVGTVGLCAIIYFIMRYKKIRGLK